jgi:signal transduction histidine kinase
VAAIARNPALQAFLQAPGPESRAAAQKILNAGATDPSRRGTELLDPSGLRLLGSRDPVLEDRESFDPSVARLDSTGAAFAPMIVVHDSISMPAISRIMSDGKVVAYVVRWRRLTGSSEAVQSLLGSGARVFLRNRDGSVWTDFGKAVDAPLAVPQDSAGIQYFNDDVVPAMGMDAVVPGTAWNVFVEFPTAEILAGPRSIVRRLILVGLLLLLAAAVVAWRLSGGVTGDVMRLAAAADAIRAGDYSRRTQLQRSDELGTLGSVFNAMAENIEHGHERLEERVRGRTAELEAVNRELEAFSYSVSHDLRSPLRSLDGFSQALAEDYAAVLDDTGRDYLQRIRAGAQRMDRLIDDLLVLARVARLDMSRSTVDVTAVTRAIFDDLRRGDPDRTVDIVVAPDMTAFADPVLLRVVMDNLLANAWKFTGPSAAPRIEVGCRMIDGAKTFFVQDNGVGFDMAYADKLFAPFQRLHGMNEFAGTGVGLATVQRIIARHGGTIRAESAPGHGAIFYFTIQDA